MPSRVLLVDDHTMVRDGLKAIFARDREFTVVGEAEGGAEAVQVCKQSNPDLVLMDVALPGMNGIEATAEILRRCPRAKVVILSMHGDENLLKTAIRSGASGFVLKKASASELLLAMRIVARGGTYLAPSLGSNNSGLPAAQLQRSETAEKERHAVESLSPREAQVLRLIAEGKRSKEVAAVLGLEHNTVRSYRKTMMRKLGVNNLASLIQVAMAAGLIYRDKESSGSTET
jgi:DNA-binding NarL/FixJ family response regulator